MKNKRLKIKKVNRNIKIYFIILNLLLSTIAFSILISGSSSLSTTGTPTGGRITPGTTSGTSGGTGTTVTGTSTPPGNGIVQIGGGSTPGTPPAVVNTQTGNTGTVGTGTSTTSTTTTQTSSWTNLWGNNAWTIIQKASIGAGVFGTIGALGGGKDGALWGAVAGAVGGAVAGLTEKWLGSGGSILLGLGVATIIYVLTYEIESQKTVEFSCYPWEAPIGGDDCELCNTLDECSEYTCKSLGQACDIANAGTTEQKCFWKNPQDVNSPKIQMINVSTGHKYKPDTSVRPPATGVTITQDDAECLEAFTPLQFSFSTDEPAQCKIDYDLTSDPKKAMDEMDYYVGGNTLFIQTHSEKLSLPGPSAVNSASPQLTNDGKYILYTRCKDANGNFNQDAYSISFCVDPGPDTTPPNIVSANIPSGKPVQFNQTKLDLEIYVNEPAECKWSRTDQKYSLMENNMTCDTNVWEMNNNLVYTCKTIITGIQNQKENQYFFRCKDQPWSDESDRNTNLQSFGYKVIGTRPLNIMSLGPNSTIAGSTDTVPVFLNVLTDNGYNSGEALCYYSQGKPAKEENYILFLETGGTNHTQRQDLISGKYIYYMKCVDLGGNTAYNTTSFIVESDKQPPWVVRVYRDSGELRIITNEETTCSYSVKDCNFEIDSGIQMNSNPGNAQTAEWNVNQNYYIRCKDRYDNQPNPNVCTIILRPSKVNTKSEVIEF